jgi:hypothetical protein
MVWLRGFYTFPVNLGSAVIPWMECRAHVDRIVIRQRPSIVIDWLNERWDDTVLADGAISGII